MKSNIINLHVKTQLLENNIQTSNKSLLNCEDRISELFIKYAEITTTLGVNGENFDRLSDEINRITGIYAEDSLPNHGTYISDLNSRLKKI